MGLVAWKWKGMDIRDGDLRKHGGLDDGNKGRGKGSMTDWGRDWEGKEGGRGGGVWLSGKRRRRRKGGEGNHRSRTQGRRVTRDKVVG